MGYSRQEYWSGLPFPSPGDFPNPGVEPTLQADSSLSEPPRKQCVYFNPKVLFYLSPPSAISNFQKQLTTFFFNPSRMNWDRAYIYFYLLTLKGCFVLILLFLIPIEVQLLEREASIGWLPFSTFTDLENFLATKSNGPSQTFAHLTSLRNLTLLTPGPVQFWKTSLIFLLFSWLLLLCLLPEETTPRNSTLNHPHPLCSCDIRSFSNYYSEEVASESSQEKEIMPVIWTGKSWVIFFIADFKN